jgi:hypothetical protein
MTCPHAGCGVSLGPQQIQELASAIADGGHGAIGSLERESGAVYNATRMAFRVFDCDGHVVAQIRAPTPQAAVE